MGCDICESSYSILRKFPYTEQKICNTCFEEIKGRVRKIIRFKISHKGVNKCKN